jgi:hypothetical protein
VLGVDEVGGGQIPARVGERGGFGGRTVPFLLPTPVQGVRGQGRFEGFRVGREEAVSGRNIFDKFSIKKTIQYHQKQSIFKIFWLNPLPKIKNLFYNTDPILTCHVTVDIKPRRERLPTRSKTNSSAYSSRTYTEDPKQT